MSRRGDELLTVDQLIAEMGVARRTFYRWRELRRGPAAIRLPNGELRFWRSDYQRWLTTLEDKAE
jgi:predicted DNA-binding transcriptional regulator AlpA